MSRRTRCLDLSRMRLVKIRSFLTFQKREPNHQILDFGLMEEFSHFPLLLFAFANTPAEEIARSSPSYDIPQSPAGQSDI